MIARLAVAAALLAGSLPGTAQAAAQDPEIVVEAPSFRAEIERILEADNLDVATLAPGQVADRMRAIARGSAPDDFWSGYQQHVGAWQRYAALAEQADAATDDLAEARRTVNATFDEVERIALRYGARLPRPASAQ